MKNAFINISLQNGKCIECGAYYSHHPKCSLIDEKSAKELLQCYYDAWSNIEIKHEVYCNILKDNIIKAKKDAELRKRKFLEVTNENNKLRKKVAKQYPCDTELSFTIDFIKWYSGMEEQKILNAHKRYKKEKVNTH